MIMNTDELKQRVQKEGRVGGIEIEGRISKKGVPRDVTTRSGAAMVVVDAELTDDSGSVALSLWNKEIDQFNVNDVVRISNGYATSFRGTAQLSAGRLGTITLKP